MTTKQLQEWYKLYKQYKNGYHLSIDDFLMLGELNNRLMKITIEVNRFICDQDLEICPLCGDFIKNNHKCEE